MNLDALTYAGNPENLSDVDLKYSGSKYRFVHGDITDSELISSVMEKHDIDLIIHLAAESHVDRSIHGPADFIRTNIFGTFVLLEAARKYWKNRTDVLFHHVSTDEVYGSLNESGLFTETSPYNPRSPYSATKAGSDHLVSAYFHTYQLPITISNCSNNYGPYQFPEKLIPLMILNMINSKPLPVYGDGLNIRDWVHVDDHNEGIWRIVTNGTIGSTYNLGGGNERTNIDLVKILCTEYSQINRQEKEELLSLIRFIEDRPGHDRRYAIDSTKLKSELGWKHSIDFQEGIRNTINWYLSHLDWVEQVKSGEYQNWIEKNYSGRM